MIKNLDDVDLITESHMYVGYAEAFTIFAKYTKADEPDCICASHDRVTAGPYDTDVVSDDDKYRLAQLGWRVDSDGGFYKFT